MLDRIPLILMLVLASTECVSSSVYVALFDGQTRLFELDSQVCENNVGVTQAIFEEMRNSFKP